MISLGDRIELANLTLFHLINADQNAPLWKIRTALFFAEITIYAIPIVIAYFLVRKKDRRLAMTAMAAIILAMGITYLIRTVWYYPRPFDAGIGRQLLSHQADGSCPSMHVTVFTVFGLWLLYARQWALGGVTLLVGTMVALARVFLGVHYPIDMLGSLVVAIISCECVSVAQEFAIHRKGAH